MQCKRRTMPQLEKVVPALVGQAAQLVKAALVSERARLLLGGQASLNQLTMQKKRFVQRYPHRMGATISRQRLVPAMCDVAWRHPMELQQGSRQPELQPQKQSLQMQPHTVPKQDQ